MKYTILDLNTGNTLAIIQADSDYRALQTYLSNYGYRINIKAVSNA